MIKIKLKEILNKEGVSGKQLAEELSIRPTTISELVNNQRTTINKEHLAKIMKRFDIKDFNEILELEEGD